MDKAYQICIEIFQQREYKITEQDDNSITATKPNGETICAFTTNTPKFNINSAQEYIGYMNERDIKHSIIIYKDGVTSSATKIGEKFTDMEIELFSEAELQYNITKHRFQPKFKRLTVEDSTQFKKDYGTKFPVILKSDPIARFFNYKRGDVIQITRKDGYVTYRIVK